MTRSATHPHFSAPSTELVGPGLRFVVRRRAPGVLAVEIHGDDRDQLGTQPFAALDAELSRHSPATLFFDTTETSGATTAVRQAWTTWLAQNRTRLTAVHILTSSKFVSTAVGVAKHFSRTGELIRIGDDRAAFERVLATAVAAAAR
jgi:hypothetical protein